MQIRPHSDQSPTQTLLEFKAAWILSVELIMDWALHRLHSLGNKGADTFLMDNVEYRGGLEIVIGPFGSSYSEAGNSV